MVRIGIVVIIILSAIAGLYLIKGDQTETTPLPTPSSMVLVPPTQPFDFGNQTLMLDDQTLPFKDGSYTDNATHTAKIENRMQSASGNQAAAILIDQPGGSGTFYYLVGAVMKDGKEVYSTPILLGDRIKFVKASVSDPGDHDNGEITVEYVDRGPKDPMSAEPTKQMTKKYSFEDSGELIEVLH
jgi:hypothetical protein